MKIWVIIWRLNPPHIWHVNLIKKSIKQSDKTIVILWSSNLKDYNNPFSFEERKSFLKKIFSNKVEIKKSNDYESDKKWYEEIKKILKNFSNNKIIFYWWDLENDSAIKMIKQFWNFKEKNFKEEKRSKINISSTKIRQHLKEKNLEEAEKWLPEQIYRDIIKMFS